jgi:hypothetical protein
VAPVVQSRRQVADHAPRRHMLIPVMSIDYQDAHRVYAEIVFFQSATVS